MRRRLNKVIADDLEQRPRPDNDRYDKHLVEELISTCQSRSSDAEEAVCVFRRFLTLEEGMHIAAVDMLLESVDPSTSNAMEMSA